MEKEFAGARKKSSWKCKHGTHRAKLGGDVHHRVAFGTNYMQEAINSKIIENYRTDNRSLVQLITLDLPYYASSTSTPKLLTVLKKYLG